MDNLIKDKRRRSASPEDDSVRSGRRVRRQRATRKRASRGKPEPEIEPVKAVEPEPAVEAKPGPTGRKAPTQISATKARKKFAHKRLVIVSVVVLIGIGSSAMVGFTDSGQINVQQTIEERNERIRTNQASEGDTVTSNIEVPVQNTNTNSRPNGGLRGLGVADTSTYRQGSTPVNNTPATSTPETDGSTASSTGESLVEEEVSSDEPEPEPEPEPETQN